MTAWRGHSSTNDALDACLSDIAWYRPTDSSSKSYQQHLAIFLRHSELGLISRPPMFTVDDWDLLEEEWAAGSPIIFRSPHHYAQWVLVKAFFTKANILPIGHGLSELLYRRAPRKQAITCERGDACALRRYGTNRIHMTLAVPALDGGTSRAVSQALVQIEEDARLDVARIKEHDVYCVRRADLPIGHASITDELCCTLAELVTRGDSFQEEHVSAMTNGLNPDGIEQWPADGAGSIVLASRAFLMICSDIDGFAYIPGRGFLCEDGAEECSGGIYFWWDRSSAFSSGDAHTILLSECCESIRTLRVSVRDWNRRNNQAILNHACRAAIAAIMSRNMSHNLGSHALANSKFFESVGLLNEKEGREVRKEEVQIARSRLQTFNQYCQGRLDFIARKLSEDGEKPEPMLFIGDVLSGFMNQEVLLNTLLDDNGFTTKNISFHIGVNGRADDPACSDAWKYHTDPDSSAVESKAKRSELILVELRQSADGPVVDATGTRWEWLATKATPKVEDKLIGLAGGVTGAHALYALLENILRNAAKYSGKNRAAGMCLNLELRDYKASARNEAESKDCLLLRIWENQTDDTDRRAVVDVRNALNQELFNPETSAAVTGGHGIHEMRLCAEYLSGGEQGLRFPDESLSHQTVYHKPEHQDEAYVAFLGSEDEKQSPSARLRNRALRAYRTNKGGRQALVYELLIPKPLLLGISCVKQGRACKTCQSEHPNVKRFDTIEKLASQDAHFGLILAHDSEKMTIDYALREVERFHTQLPYRLMIVTRDAASQKLWADAVLASETSPSRPMPPRRDAKDTSDATLPVRRVHVIEHGEMFVEHSDCRCVATLNSDENDPALIAGVYDEWLRVWKGEPPGGRWKLCIGFNRDAEHIRNRWKEPLRKNKQYGAGLFDVFIASRNAVKGSGDTVWLARRLNGESSESVSGEHFPRVSDPQMSSKLDVLPEAAIVYDNHGKVFTGLHESRNWRVYHKFGVAQLGLYQALETPPQEGLPFVFFLFSLLEGSLFNVLTLDERVADATIRDGRFDMSFDGGLLLPMRNAGIHPLFTFAREDREVSRADDSSVSEHGNSRDVLPFLSPHVKAAMERLKRKADHCAISLYEGLRYLADGTVEIRTDRRKEAKYTSGERWTYWRGGSFIDPVSDGIVQVPDAIVIHEGLTDAWSKRHLWRKGEDHLALYQAVPAVVRTSGRGRQSRELGDALPFIELSVLSDSTYGSLNKPKLARAILNATGMPDRGGETS